MWGNASVTKMGTSSCIASNCVATDVVTGTTAVCSQVKEEYQISNYMDHIIFYIDHIIWSIFWSRLDWFWYRISHQLRMQHLIVTMLRRSSGLFHSMNVKSIHHLTMKRIITNMIFSSIPIDRFSNWFNIYQTTSEGRHSTWHIFKCNTSPGKNLLKHCIRLCYKTNATSEIYMLSETIWRGKKGFPASPSGMRGPPVTIAGPESRSYVNVMEISV